MGDSDRSSAPVTVAVIGALSVLGAAFFSNIDKIFPSKPPVQATTSNQDPGTRTPEGDGSGSAPHEGTAPEKTKNQIPSQGSGTSGAGQDAGPAARGALLAPVQLQPANGSVFSNFPRTTQVVWQPVPNAASYTAEVDCFQCCDPNAWCTDVGKTWNVHPGLTTTNYTFNWVGAQQGRWRVWAIAQDGTAGPKSPWSGFTYTK